VTPMIRRIFDLEVRGLLRVAQPKKNIMEAQDKDGPQYPASEGAKISVQSVETQGVMRGQATCVIHRGEELSPGLLSRTATGETSRKLSSYIRPYGR